MNLRSANTTNWQGAPKAAGDVAIIGMACMFPGAPDLETFWQNIVNKVDAVTDPPPEAWAADVFYDPNSSANDRVYCKRGGYLGPLAVFNPLDYGIMPVGLDGGEPDQWLALKVAYDALADANYLERLKERPEERHRTAIILGKGTYLNRGNLNMVQHSLVVDQTLQALRTLHPEYTDDDLQLIRQELKTKLPPFNAEAALGLVPNIVAGRIANRLDLMGPTYTVDAACASSLIAIEVGMRELLTGQCDLALVGGIQVTTPIPILTLFCQLNALSRRQEIRPFDKDADGTVLGEGIGLLLLKRCEEAERDGDRIYAFIKGGGSASDGRAMGVLTPRVEGERLALQRAYTVTGIAPETVELIEAHGTGTPVGDATEIQALQELFGRRADRLPHCALGSVKSMIGHTMPAAGVAGVIKAALALYHKVLPPTLHCDELNPKIELEKTACYINTETRPWIHGDEAAPRRAGVNAFGFGGINAHVILEENLNLDEATAPNYSRQWESEVTVLEAASRERLIERARQLQAHLEVSPESSLLDLAYTLNTGLGRQPWRLSVVAQSRDDLRQKLAQALRRLADPGCRQIKDVKGIYFFETPLYPSGRLAFLFPGEGAQYPNMLADLCLHFPDVRACFDRMDRIFVGHPRRYMPSDFIFPRPAVGQTRPETDGHLWQEDVAIEAVLAANQALFTLLSRLGLHPQVVVGHSTGEYSAMRAAGVIPLDDDAFIREHLLDLNRIYSDRAANALVEAPAQALRARASLLTVGAGLDQVSAILKQVRGEIYVGMDNCPHQTVLVGEAAAVKAAEELMRKHGLIFETLPFDRTYHTPLFTAYSQTLLGFFERLPLAPPQTRLYSCTTAAPYPDDVAEIRSLAAEHWFKPVRFRETIQTMYADGARLFVEVGPRGNLTAFVEDTLRGQPHLAIPANLLHRSGISQINHLLGLLSAQGVPVHFDYLYQRRRPRRLPLEQQAIASKEPQGLLKLATGWAGMEISPEAATRLRERVARRSAETRSAAPPSPASPTLEGAAQMDDLVERREPDQQPVSPGLPVRAAERVMQAHFQLMEQFLETQQVIMQAFLAKSAPASPDSREAQWPSASSTSATAELASERPVFPDESETSYPAPESIPVPRLVQENTLQASADQPRWSPDDESPEAQRSGEIRSILLRLVSEKTGYPIEMLDVSADLEADLGIDSIKRVEVLGAFDRETGLLDRQQMDQVLALKTLQAIIDVIAARSDSAPGLASESQQPQPSQPLTVSENTASEPRAAAWPFIRTIRSLTPGQELVALCTLDLAEDLFLNDHTLGGFTSTEDRELTALPVVPLTISTEIMAEAAACLLPDLVLTGMRDIRAHRWLLLEDQTITLQVVARRKSPPEAHAVEVYVREAGDEGQTKHRPPIVEGVVLFSPTYPQAPSQDAFSLRAERPSRWTPSQLYTQGMFHGPAFQAVTSMERSGEDGATATLQALPAGHFFRSRADPALIAEPILLDAAGQVIGLWTVENLETGFVVFPFRFDALNIFGPPLQPAEQVKCQARIHLLEGGQVRSNIDLLGPDGRLRLQLVGWEDRRVDLSRRFYNFVLAPRERLLSEAWAAPLSSRADKATLQCCCVTGFPDGFFEAHGAFWEKVLAYLVLNRAERAAWRRLIAKQPHRRRIDWLLGRVAAKDAIRLFVQETYGLTLAPADVEIVADERGRPGMQGAWLKRLDKPPLISLAHSDGIAVALAGEPGDESPRHGLGIDIERVSRPGQSFEAVAFTPAERALLAALVAEQPAEEAWPLRLWCAKEAVGKAFGQGLASGPLGIVARDIQAQAGIIRLGLEEDMARQFPDINGALITAYTVREGDFVVASVLR